MAVVVVLGEVVVDVVVVGVVVVDAIGSHTSPDGALLFDVSVGSAMAAVTGVVIRNNAVADTASTRVMFRLRMKCGADIKVILPLVYISVGATLTAAPELSKPNCQARHRTRTNPVKML